MDPIALAASRIIKEQSAIVGPMVALDQAKKVSGLQVNTPDDIKVSGNGKDVLTSLVEQYSKLFGKASIEVCKEAIEPIADKIPVASLPDILKN